MNFDTWLAERLGMRGFGVAATGDAGGRAVTAALKAFQNSVHLPETGLADTLTVNELRKDPSATGGHSTFNPVPAKSDEPAWMREARRFMGLQEVPGPKSNPTILGWAKALGGWVVSFYKDDDTPWCGLFMAHCIGATLPNEILPSNPLSALAWKEFGIGLSQPALGAILVFTRDGGGHVGDYLGEDETHYHVVGGNQKNSVSITRVEKRRCSAIRWPKTGERPTGGRIWLKPNGEVSRNEA